MIPNLQQLHLRFKIVLRPVYDRYQLLIEDDVGYEIQIPNLSIFQTTNYTAAVLYFTALMHSISNRNYFELVRQENPSFYERCAIFKLSENYDDNLNRRWGYED